MKQPLSEEERAIAAMERLRNGDDLALNDIMEQWTNRVHAYLFRYLGNAEDARDLTQETFVAVYASRFRYRPSGTFSSWLFGIASNLARQRLRWRSRHPEVALEMQENEDGVANYGGAVNAQTPASDIEAKERVRCVKSAIASLPYPLRELVLLSEYEEMPHAEIAKIAGCSVKAVETRLYRARKILAERLAHFLKD